MGRTELNRDQGGKPPARTAARVLSRHIQTTLRQRWRSYRKHLKRLPRKISEPAVHELRVQTRRLLAEVDLLGTLLTGGSLRKLSRELKKRLDSFDELRDTQVQLRLVKELLCNFSEGRSLREELRHRSKRLTKRAARRVARSGNVKLAAQMGALKGQLKALFQGATSHERLLGVLIAAVDRAYARTVALRRRIIPADTATIHRTRVAFKRFRYMVELLQPVLPGIGPRELKRMHDYQTRMGEIQDIEVFLARVDKWVARKRLEAKPLRPLRRELLGRRRALIRAYLNSADELFKFWDLDRKTEIPKRRSKVLDDRSDGRELAAASVERVQHLPGQNANRVLEDEEIG